MIPTKNYTNDKNSNNDDFNNNNNNNNMNKQTFLLLIDAAKQCYNKGSYYYKKKKYNYAINKYKQCITIRESVFGRYHIETAYAYYAIGDSYYLKRDYNNAIIPFRIYLRIRKHLSDFNHDQCLPSLFESLKHIGGLKSMNKINLYHTNLNTSIQYEIDGDNYRTKGNFVNAVNNYLEAIVIEKNDECCIKVDIITLTFLWRKIALISGRSNDTYSGARTNWKQVDQINNRHYKRGGGGRRQEKVYGVSDDVFDLVQQGDSYYISDNYELALECYQKACDLTRENIKTMEEEKLTEKPLANVAKQQVVQSNKSQQRMIEPKTFQNVVNKINVIENDIMEQINDLKETINNLKIQSNDDENNNVNDKTTSSQMVQKLTRRLHHDQNKKMKTNNIMTSSIEEEEEDQSNNNNNNNNTINDIQNENIINLCYEIHNLLESGSTSFDNAKNRIMKLEESGQLEEAIIEYHKLVESQSLFFHTLQDGWINTIITKQF